MRVFNWYVDTRFTIRSRRLIPVGWFAYLVLNLIHDKTKLVNWIEYMSLNANVHQRIIKEDAQSSYTYIE